MAAELGDNNQINMTNSLIAKALSFKANPKIRKVATKDEIEVVLAYCNGELTIRQLAFAFGLKHPGNGSHLIGSILMKAIRTKAITVKISESV